MNQQQSSTQQSRAQRSHFLLRCSRALRTRVKDSVLYNELYVNVVVCAVSVLCTVRQVIRRTRRRAARRGAARAQLAHTSEGSARCENPCTNRRSATGSRDVWHAIHTTNCERNTHASPNTAYLTLVLHIGASASTAAAGAKRSEGTGSESRGERSRCCAGDGASDLRPARARGQPHAPGPAGHCVLYCTRGARIGRELR